MLHMSVDGESYLKLFNESTEGIVYVNVSHEHGWRVKLFNKSTEGIVYVNVTHEHGWRVILETIQ
jgi:hypothetical protein